MTEVAVRDLRNNTAKVIERVQAGEDVTITVNGVPAAKLVAIQPQKKAFLTTADLLALRPKPGTTPPPYWEHEFDGDTTDELGPIQ